MPDGKVMKHTPRPDVHARHGLAPATLIILIVAPLVLFFASLCIGRYPVLPGDTFHILLSRFVQMDPAWQETAETVILKVRLPRVLMAMLLGAGLSIAGASFQGIFRNPLVGPSILGVSQGAGFGAALALLLGGNMIVVHVSAFFSGLLAVGAAYAMSRIQKGKHLLMLVLSGMIVAAVFSALISLIKYMADPMEKLPNIVFWLMGSLAGTDYHDLAMGFPFIAAGSMVLVSIRWRINILALGDETATAFGENTRLMRIVVILASTVITASTVALSGIIGWVGLLIPHITRMIVGPNHSYLLPASLSIGSVYLLLMDDIARSAGPGEIPLSILTALIGAPFFGYLLRYTGGRWS